MQKSHLLPMTATAILLGTVLACAIPPSLLGQVNKKDSGGQVVFSVGPKSGSSCDEVSAAFVCPGDAACTPGVVHVLLTFLTYKQLPKYDDDHAVSFVLDEDTGVSVANPTYRARKGVGRQVWETITCIMPTADFLELTAARGVDLRVGNQEAKLSREQLQTLAQLAAAIPKGEEDP